MKRFNSIYRELLFLTLTEYIDEINSGKLYRSATASSVILYIISLFSVLADDFDLQYNEAFESLILKEKESLDLIDNPPTIGAIFCRNLFRQLALK